MCDCRIDKPFYSDTKMYLRKRERKKQRKKERNRERKKERKKEKKKERKKERKNEINKETILSVQPSDHRQTH